METKSRRSASLPPIARQGLALATEEVKVQANACAEDIKVMSSAERDSRTTPAVTATPPALVGAPEIGYNFAISMQYHVDRVIKTLPRDVQVIDLVFCRNTREDGKAYDLSGLVAFNSLKGLAITPEEQWQDPIHISIPSSVISRLAWISSDRINLAIVQEPISSGFMSLNV